MEAKMVMKWFGAGLLALSMTAGAAGAAPIFFDDFETPNNTRNWQVYQNFGNWGEVTGAGIEIQTNGTLAGVSSYNGGDQYVELDSDRNRGGTNNPTNSSMTTRLTLSAGTYEVSWYYQPRTAATADNLIEVFISGLSQGLFDNAAIGSASGGRTSTTDWVRYTHRFTVDGTDNDYGLTFRAGGTQNTLGGLMDNVSVSQVPVPAAGLLLLAGLGGLAAFRRRKSA